VLDRAGLEVYRVWRTADGVIVQVPLQQLAPGAATPVLAAVQALPGIARARFSGVRLSVRSTAAIDEVALRSAVTGAGLDVLAVVRTDDVGEIGWTITVAGPEQRYRRAIEASLPVDASSVRIESIGPRSGPR
jgi:hypothetical protein